MSTSMGVPAGTGRPSGGVEAQDVEGPAVCEDGRQAYRIVVDVLATPEQVDPLVTVLGTAVCGHPDDHPGSCRVAWRITVAGPGGGLPLTAADERQVRAALVGLEAWPPERATADLVAEVERPCPGGGAPPAPQPRAEA